LETLLRRGRRRLLLRGVIEDHRAILRADVGPLPIRRGRIMAVPENVEQLLVGNTSRVVLDLDDLRVSGAITAHVAISRILQPAPRVADRRRRHARHAPERRLDAPETAGAECRLCHVLLLLKESGPLTPPFFLMPGKRTSYKTFSSLHFAALG